MFQASRKNPSGIHRSPRTRKAFLAAAIVVYGWLIMGCFSGSIAQEGGPVGHPLLISSATLTRGVPYQIVCWDQDEILRREKAGLTPDGKSADAPASGDGQKDAKSKDGKDQAPKTGGEKKPTGASGQVLGPAVKYRSANGYSGGCEVEGRHSTFFLMGIFPVTAPLNPDYAISDAVQRLGGDTMINIRAWHETHYYSVLGKVEVFKVRGDVVRFVTAPRVEPKPKKKKKRRRRGRRRRGRRR